MRVTEKDISAYVVIAYEVMACILMAYIDGLYSYGPLVTWIKKVRVGMRVTEKDISNADIEVLIRSWHMY